MGFKYNKFNFSQTLKKYNVTSNDIKVKYWSFSTLKFNIIVNNLKLQKKFK